MSQIQVDTDVLYFALKYSLTRRSHAPSIVRTNILRNYKNMSNNDLVKILKEIESKEEFIYNEDRELWLNLVEYIKKEMKVRFVEDFKRGDIDEL